MVHLNQLRFILCSKYDVDHFANTKEEEAAPQDDDSQEPPVKKTKVQEEEIGEKEKYVFIYPSIYTYVFISTSFIHL